jgi:hypothetical protein
MLQPPSSVGQLPAPAQAAPVALQVPEFGQSLADEQACAGVAEQCPATGPQSLLLEQLSPLELHAPGTGHCAALVQLIAGLVLHVPGPHAGTTLQGPHSLVHKLHPGGSKVGVQVDAGGGIQVGEVRLHV